MVYKYAWAGAFVALLPLASFFLIPLELFMIYRIADRNGRFELPSFLAMGAALFTLSAFLKGAASALHVIFFLGQLANAAVAFTFIWIVGTLAERHYEPKSR